MDPKKINNFWKLFAGLLIVLNITLCIFVWLTLQQEKEPRKEQPFEFVTHKLQLTDNQVAEYTKLRANHHDSMELLRHEGKELRKQLFAQLWQDTVNKPYIDSLANAIGQNQQLIEMVTYRHFAKIKALCNDRQKKVFSEIMQDLLDRLMGPKQPPPPGGHMRSHGGMPPHENSELPVHP